MRRKISRTSKTSARELTSVLGNERMARLGVELLASGKSAIDQVISELGRMLVEGVLLMERESVAGPDYKPASPAIKKGGRQAGSAYIGKSKVRILRPRVRDEQGELKLSSYERMQQKEGFSEELLSQCLSGLSGRQYEDTLRHAGEHFGVSPSSVSRRVIEATAAELRAFQERRHEDFKPFALFLDTIHRGGRAFIVALGIDAEGIKRPLGFWEGATENSDICQELFGELEQKGLNLSADMIFVTDGGSGIIKALRERFGAKLLHQRCTIHKVRNLEKHLSKKYRKEAARRFRDAIDCVQYSDAKKALGELESWLLEINASAANSLREASEELLTLHRLRVPALLRKTLHSTNPIESMFSVVRDCESNIKRLRSTAMAQRWLAASLREAERSMRRIKGYKDIAGVLESIKKLRAEKKVA